VVARDQVLVMLQSLELGGIDPLFQDELELALQVGAAEEDRQPPVRAVIGLSSGSTGP
jgi:hypothetical protein